MNDLRINAELTMCVNHDFQQLVTDLRSQHFVQDRAGYLVYRSPFMNPGEDNALTFKFKPKVEGSTIYSVIFEGQFDNVAGILHNTFRTYDAEVRMINFNVHIENYNQATFSKLVKTSTSWTQTEYDQNIFKLPQTGASCLLMGTHICFLTRSIKTFQDVNDFFECCNQHVKVFKPELEFNLFTCNEFK